MSDKRLRRKTILMKLSKNSIVGTRCCASATVNPTRTRSTASLPDHVCTISPNVFTASLRASSALPPFSNGEFSMIGS